MTTKTTVQRKTVSSVILLSILFAITLTYATPEDNYINDTNPLSGVYESSHTEGNYKATIIINPYTTGIYANEYNYKLDLTINKNPIGGSLTENNYKLDLIPQKSFPELVELHITGITPNRTIVGKGLKVNIRITVSNQEFNSKTFYLTTCANTTALETKTLTLTSRDTTTVDFTWDTTSFIYGNYTVRAIIWPVLGNTYTTETRICKVLVTIPGDVNGDKRVSVADWGVMSDHWTGPPSGVYPYDANCDANDDGRIGVSDWGVASDHWGQSW